MMPWHLLTLICCCYFFFFFYILLCNCHNFLYCSVASVVRVRFCLFLCVCSSLGNVKGSRLRDHEESANVSLRSSLFTFWEDSNKGEEADWEWAGSYPQAGAVCVGADHREAVSWLVASTNCESNDAGEIPSHKVLKRTD